MTGCKGRSQVTVGTTIAVISIVLEGELLGANFSVAVDWRGDIREIPLGVGRPGFCEHGFDG